MTPENAPVTPARPISSDDIVSMRHELKMSLRGALNLCTELRAASKRKDIVESDMKTILDKQSHELDDIYSVTCFDDNNKKIVYCNNLHKLMQKILESRRLSPFDKIHIKIGIDSGGDFLKVCFNVIETERAIDESKARRRRYSDGVSPKSKKDTSVNKLIVVAITNEKKESYETVAKIWELLQKCKPLHSFADVTIASDLKMANILTGLMAHSSSHPCTWCDAHR